MATNYPSSDPISGAALESSNYGVDKAVSTGRVSNLIDILKTIWQTGSELRFAETTTTSTTFVRLHDSYQVIPDWATIEVLTLKVTLKVKVSAGTGTLKLVVNSVSGPEVTVTSTTYVDKELTISMSTLSQGTWKFEVQAKSSAGSVTTYVKGEDADLRFED